MSETEQTETIDTEALVPEVTEAEQAETTATRNARKVREGVAVSVKQDKTVVVAVIDRVRHRRYRKTVQRTTKLYAHDENNEVREGDRVRITETRPMSRLKRWRVVEILERAR
ncbi:MAG: 30S ribosomal protein S17 [Actinomycetes bacterium]